MASTEGRGGGSIYPNKADYRKIVPSARPGKEEWRVKLSGRENPYFIEGDSAAYARQWAESVDQAYDAGRDQDIRNASVGHAVAAWGRAREAFIGLVGPVGLPVGSTRPEQVIHANQEKLGVLKEGVVPETSRMLAALEVDLTQAIADLSAYYAPGGTQPLGGFNDLEAEIDGRALAMENRLSLIIPGGVVPPELQGLVRGLALDQARAVLRRKQARTEAEFTAQLQREKDYPWGIFGGAAIPTMEFKASGAEQQRKDFEQAVAEFQEAADQKAQWGTAYLTKAYYKSAGRAFEEKPSKLNEIPWSSLKAIYVEPGGRELLETFAAHIVFYRSAGPGLGPLQHAGARFKEWREMVARNALGAQGHMVDTPKGRQLIEAAWNCLYVGHLGESAQTRVAPPLADAKVVDPVTGVERSVLEQARAASDYAVDVVRDPRDLRKITDVKVHLPDDPVDLTDPLKLKMQTGKLPFVNQRSGDVAVGGDLPRLMHPQEAVMGQLRTGESWGAIADWVKMMTNKGRRGEVIPQVVETYPERIGKSFFEMQKVWVGGAEQVPMLQALLLKQSIDFDRTFETRATPFSKYMVDLGDLKGVFEIYSGAAKVEFKADAASLEKLAVVVGETLRAAGMDDQPNRDNAAKVLAVDLGSNKLGIPLGTDTASGGLGKIWGTVGLGPMEGNRRAGGAGRIGGQGFFSRKAFK